MHTRLFTLMKQRRRKAGLTQAELARATGRTQAYVSKSEAGQLRLVVEDFVLFCHAMQTDPYRMLDAIVDDTMPLHSPQSPRAQ